MKDRPSLTYRDAGVDIDAGEALVERIKPHVRRTLRPEVLGGLGGFGALFELPPGRWRHPVLVAGTDGVGTKLKLAIDRRRHSTIGIDLVAMCVNDVVVQGAEPLFFLDYVAVGKLDSARMERIVAGIAEGCVQAGCALVGGEMAEHPGTMAPADYDLCGFCVGVVDRPKMITGDTIAPGDVILGLASNGLHSNGFSLVRKVLVEGREAELAVPRVDLGGITLGELLLTPTRIYVKSVLATLVEVPIKGMAHITGGGITENLDRALPATCDARVVRSSWKVPPVFGLVQEAAGIDDDSMYRTFNMGVGFALIVDRKHAPAVAVKLRELGETVAEIGEVVEGTGVVTYA